MRPDFTAVSATTLETALDLMGNLYAGAGDAYDRPRARRAAQWLLEHPAGGGVWLIRGGAEIAGYLVVTACFSLEFGGEFGLLDELYLEPAWRGQGIGPRAIEFASAWCVARGMQALRLEVARDNQHALRIYERAGFIAHNRDLMTKWL
jgi:GNAT superfamily N-acetyltransferase